MQKQRVIIIIDGSNFYFKLKSLRIKNTSQFNYHGFINWLKANRQLISCTYYIGVIKARTNDIIGQRLRLQQRKVFNHLLKHGVKIEKGFLMKSAGSFHEKGVDVKMAVDMLVGAYENIYETVILISSDTDLVPAIKKVREKGKEIEYIGFIHEPSLGIKRYATVTKLLSKQDLQQFAVKYAKVKQ